MGAFKNFYLDTVKGRPSAEVLNGILCIHALLQRKMEDYFKPYGLSPVKFNTLMLLKHLGDKGGVSQNEICHHLIVSPSNITRLIDRLIIDGYAERTISTKDRRVKLIRITKEGEKILDEVFYGFGEMTQQAVYLLERKEVEQLSSILLKWFTKLDRETEVKKERPVLDYA